MKIILSYISIVCCLLSCLSCKKQHELTTGEIIKSKPIEILDISISNELLEEELHKIKVDSSVISLKNKDSVIAFYQLRNGKAAWEKAKNRNAFYFAIKNAAKEGLIPEDYNLQKIETINTKANLESANNVFLDLFFTDTYLTYAYHLANGKIDPKKLYKDWRLDDNVFQFNNTLSLAINNLKLAESFESYKPKHKIYQQLITELPIAKQRLEKDSLRTIIDYGAKIRPNKSNDRIIHIRKRLNELGYLEDSLVNNSKVLDTLLQEGLKKFQLQNNLQVDAIIGESTVAVLNRNYKDKYLSILANLERWRWFPRNFGSSAIVVNIPQYQLTYIAENKRVNHNIVVGKTARKTPVFSSTVRHIDFNPKWYIPPTIKKEDIIPSATKNVDYLRKKNISVFNRQGKQMILDSINWNSRAPFSYSYVQASGNSNALGRLKIIFPNDFSVYLHDTPSKSLFSKNYRAKSSGCVRVQDVYKLASEILDWPEDDIISIVDKKTAKRVLPEKQTKVHLLYWSVIFNKKSEPIFLNDVYKLDQELGLLLAN
ncbi:MAG: L,D-transpeptidase family protein [Flavobacteriaceae bacterium]